MKRILGTLVLILIAGIARIHSQEAMDLRLPSPQTDIGKPLMQVLKLRQTSRSFDTKQLPIQELSNLLWAGFGISRPESGKRTAPSAMNWQEIDIYVASADGAFLYDAKRNALKLIVNKDLRQATGRQPFVKDAPVTFVYVSDGTRMRDASEEDKVLYTAANAGFIAQNVYLYCASQGLAVVVRGMIDRPALTREMNLRPEQKILLAQTIGYPKP